MISTHGWLDTSDVHVNTLIRQFLADGLTQVICTDISRDGMLQGPNYQLYAELLREFPTIQFTLSGGVAGMDDLIQAQQTGVHAAIIGKALYEGKVTLNNLKQWKRN